MSTFADNFIFYVLFVGLYQALFATAVAVTILPLVSCFAYRSYRNLLAHFAHLNVYLLGWGGVGNFLWLQLTANRLSVADDCPVWVPFVPFGRWMLDSAAGWRGGWQLLEGTTVLQLQLLWAAIAVPVWLISFYNAWAFRTFFARFIHRSHAS